MHTSAGTLTDSIEAIKRRPAPFVDGDTATQEVFGRGNWDTVVPFDIPLLAFCSEVGEFLFKVQRRDVENDLAGVITLVFHSTSDHVSGRKFCVVVNVRHEALRSSVAEDGTFPSYCFAYEERIVVGHTHRRMELNVFHIFCVGPC